MLTYRHLRYLAGSLVILVALLHLFHRSAGFPALVVFIEVGNPIRDPRPLAFTLSGIGLILGVLGVYNGMLPRRQAYLAGMAMMAIYLVGYATWHLTGHGGWWPFLESRHHHGNPLVILWNHFWGDPWEQVTITLELIALGLLGHLYHVEFRAGGSDGSG